MKKKQTQMDRVLGYLKNHVGITDVQARDKFGITRLSDKIFRLRGSGYEIVNVWKEGKNRYGEATRFVEYRLVK